MKLIRRTCMLILGLLAMIPLLTGCLTKSTTVGDQFSGTVIIAASPDQHPQKPAFDIPASLSGQVWAADYPAATDSTTPPAPPSTTTAPDGQPVSTPEGKIGSELTFDRLTAGQFSQLGDIIAAALPDPAATVTLKSQRSADIVRFRGSASLAGLEPNSVYFALTVSFGGEVIATNGRQIADTAVSWTPPAGQNIDMQADAEYPDPATAAVSSWAWFMWLLCAIVVAMVAYAAYQSRDRTPRPGRPARRNLAFWKQDTAKVGTAKNAAESKTVGADAAAVKAKAGSNDERAPH
ncbi:MAG: hypothetical protein WBG47_16245 [Gordonia sp. (in: high G+C Gram-positive bacteria)]|uniref:LppM family (lipo)protein n=1 Tax=Gordonia sp. (in: high G+C Gram-positive bacteria) TaxID=84139 RepID=UPI003C74B099